ncbi:MAG: Nif3-like dinuclear metal center hexameric protein [Muribaculaceae bacterium]|nr:Nif3-like dinuclear metal center hexameric protein [Muribaculaceae bacterium]
MPKVRDVINALESRIPPIWQENYDNTGIQYVEGNDECTGVMLCVDVTSEILAEAVAKSCNLIITHHPLLFRARKSFQGRDRVESVTAEAIKKGINIYSCHTSADNAPHIGVSWVMAKRLGLKDIHCLTTSDDSLPGSGTIGDLKSPMRLSEFVAFVKKCFGSPVVRSSSANLNALVKRVALCGGAGTEFITDAIKKNADVYITSDSKLNYFLDYADRIILLDIGHYEAEECTKEIFYDIITEKFPNFALYKSQSESNPVHYL